VDALAFVEAKKTAEVQPVYVLAGEERFLKLQALERIRQLVLGEGGDDFARSTYVGEATDLATVRDELATLPFLGGRRLVIIQDADGFISKYRDGLEDCFTKPSRTGVLVLDVKTWKATTRLAKLLPEAGLITCGVPERNAAAWVRGWLNKWAASQYGKKLEPSAVDLLLSLVGFELGVLDQELAKLAVFVGAGPQISAKDVDQLVGHSREENVWQMFDAIAKGEKAKALAMLHHLLDQGQDPIAVLGALGWQLRRIAQVARLRQEGVPLGPAVQRAGLFKFDQVDQLLRHLGPCAEQIFDWLLEADLGMKGGTTLPPRTVLERLIIRLAE
jgi:DNA polymerase-3 subunit delta